MQIGNYPTRTEFHKKLSSYLDSQIYIKHEYEADAYGSGNKARKLSFLLPKIIKNGYSPVILTGDVESNCCMSFSNYANEYDIDTELILSGTPNNSINFRDMSNTNAKIHLVGDWDPDIIHKKEIELMNSAISKGKKPLFLAAGMVDYTSILGAINIGKEISKQENDLGISFKRIFLPTGSGITLYSLNIAKKMLNKNWVIEGVSIANKRNYFDSFQKKMSSDLKNTELEEFANNISLNINYDYIGGGYGKYSSSDIDEIKNLRLNSNIFFDVTYMFKTFKALKEYSLNNKNSSTLLIYTGAFNQRFNKIYSGIPDEY